jgi:putative endopeptidase
MAPAWPWKQWLHKLSTCTEPFNNVPKACTHDHLEVQKVGTPEGKPLYIRNKEFFPKLNTMLSEMPLEAIRAEMRWQVVQGAAPSLSTPFQDGLLDWYKDLYGVQERSARPRKCFFATTGSVSWASAKLYSDKLFHHENRQAALDMLGNIRQQFLRAIPHADWMTPKNRDDAKYKLEQMFFEVGIPTDKENNVDWPSRAHALDGKLGPDYFRNGEIATRVSMERALSKLTRHPNRRAWGGSTPLEVNAFYGPKSNGLWIPAGILQAPFFDYQNSDAENYGSVGTILGHEMSHGFDDDGRRYDARGEMKDWWEPATVEGFKKRSSCISSLFSTYKVMNKQVNGKLTLGEDIADAGGIKFSYRAFLASKPRTDAEKRLFFASFAQTWCEVDRKKSALNQIMTDEHAPGKFRVIGGLTQFPPFAEAYHCPAGSPMAPKEEQRCHLW